MGRKSKLLNKDIYNTVIKYISNGTPIKYACVAAGIPEQRYYDWMNKADNPGDEYNIYRKFREDIKIAEAENIVHNVDNIQSASDNDSRNWPASAWLLERKYPAEFGKRMELEVGPSKVLLALQDKMSQLKFAEGMVCEVDETKLLDNKSE